MDIWYVLSDVKAFGICSFGLSSLPTNTPTIPHFFEHLPAFPFPLQHVLHPQYHTICFKTPFPHLSSSIPGHLGECGTLSCHLDDSGLNYPFILLCCGCPQQLFHVLLKWVHQVAFLSSNCSLGPQGPYRGLVLTHNRKKTL